jgi:dienelactone hydrolase
MVFLTAVRYNGLDAAVAYHGGDTDKYLGQIDGLTAPLLVHLAEEDEFISRAAQAEIKAALAGKANAAVYSYPVSVTPSPAITGCTTMPRRQRSRIGGRANFCINNCGDLVAVE